MKKLFLWVALATTLLAASCSDSYDDSGIRSDLDDLTGRVETLETKVNQANSNIQSLQQIVIALQKNVYVSKVEQLTNGYKITFTDNTTATIYNGTDGKDGVDGEDGKDGLNGSDGKDGQDGEDGKDGKDGVNGTNGKDGATPVIGVKQDADGIYYWTLNGEWLKDSSDNKIKAQGLDGSDGEDGKDGKDGQDGTSGSDGQDGSDGQNGKDGITPQLKIESDYWYISYDKGATWTKLDKATGADGTDGADGDSMFKSVTEDDQYVYFTLSDNTIIKIAKASASFVDNIKAIRYVPKYDDNKAVLQYSSVEDSFTEVNFEVSPSEYAEKLQEFSSCITAKGIYTTSRSVDFIEMPILAVSAESGVLTLKISGANLSESVFEGTQNAKVAIEIAGAQTTLFSEYIDIAPEPKYKLTTTFQTTTINEQISVAYDLTTSPIAGSENSLAYIDYGDSSAGKSATHTYALVGEHTVNFYFNQPVTKIGNKAFQSCANLIDVDYPTTVSVIDERAFYSTGLKNILIPATVLSIKQGAFMFCANAQRIELPNTITELSGIIFDGTTGSVFLDCDTPDGMSACSVFYYSNISELTIGKNVTKIGASSFTSSKNLKKITFEVNSQLTTIGSGAFAGCAIERFDVPASVQTIGDYAFANCNNLNYINVESRNSYFVSISGILYTLGQKPLLRYPPAKTDSEYYIGYITENLGADAFRNNKNLKVISFRYNSALQTIGDNAFANCANLESIEYLNQTRVETIKFRAFSDTPKLTNINLPTTVKTIENNAFSGCVGLQTLVIPENVTELQECTFYGCTNLTSIDIPQGVISIGNSVFSGCTKLGNITIPDGVSVINQGTFSNCSGLTDVVLGKGITEIHDAFENCDNLTNLYCKALVPPSLDVYPEFSKVYIPMASIDAYMSNWGNFSGILEGYNF